MLINQKIGIYKQVFCFCGYIAGVVLDKKLTFEEAKLYR